MRHDNASIETCRRVLVNSLNPRNRIRSIARRAARQARRNRSTPVACGSAPFVDDRIAMPDDERTLLFIQEQVRGAD
ncbi:MULTISPECIES: hypothetical protein [unclassified Burkholderia]|uniref:hypothetical protein n=1 Tax=unclassified Burkholderia TaxID=2613784 RepID=UPI00075CD3EB|nr:MULTISPECIES: hypothetical protein [unclassified Burkholderia]KVN09076.1 hypothetical protein WT08_15690 [Burkholderia sp. MSMB1552]KWZ57116.1 hypothetical protein WS92_15195 [Burkholderia sp. MSMB1588]